MAGERIFICHASEDKDDVARPLAAALVAADYRVWYDEHSLRLGDSLSKEIDRGLAECDYGIVVLSQAFFSKNWTQRELAGLVARETSETTALRKIILPVWHELTGHEVRGFSPMLADRVAISTSIGVAKVAEEIQRAIKAKSALDLLKGVTIAGPMQPDWGLTSDGIKYLQYFITEWEESGQLSLVAKFDVDVTEEHRRVVLEEQKRVSLFASHGMHKVFFEVFDLNKKCIGLVQPPDEMLYRDYFMALEYFLGNMDMLNDYRIEAFVSDYHQTSHLLFDVVCNPRK